MLLRIQVTRTMSLKPVCKYCVNKIRKKDQRKNISFGKGSYKGQLLMSVVQLMAVKMGYFVTTEHDN